MKIKNKNFSSSGFNIRAFYVITIFVLVFLALIFISSCKKSLSNNTDDSSDSITNKSAVENSYETDRWNKRDLKIGSLIEKDGKYYLYYAGSDLFYKFSIGITISDDLINWTDYKSNPVLDYDNSLNIELNGVYTPYVIYHDGHYKMWYTAAEGSKKRICFASSNDGLNWQKYYKNPIFKPSKNNLWEEWSVVEPCIIYHDNQYMMWYTAEPEVGESVICLAFSDDGIKWNNYENNPVMTGTISDNYDKYGVADPNITITDNGKFMMLYTGYGSQNMCESYINIAFSDDGTNWNKFENNPVITAKDCKDHLWEAGSVIDPKTIVKNGKIYLLYSGLSKLSDGRKIQIALATSEDGKDWMQLGRTSLKLVENDQWY